MKTLSKKQILLMKKIKELKWRNSKLAKFRIVKVNLL